MRLLVLLAMLAVLVPPLPSVAQASLTAPGAAASAQTAAPAATASPDADAALVAKITDQAREVMRQYRSNPTASRYPAPPSDTGPATGGQRFPFGWNVHDRDGLYAALYDVHESVVRRFNRAIHGTDTVYPFRGARAFPDGKPYGGFETDSKHWVVVPFSWLERPDDVGSARPVTTSDSLVGLALNQDQLEARGIFTMDNIAAIAVLYGSTDMRSMHGAEANLLEGFVLYHQHRDSSEKVRLLRLQEQCAALEETFAKKDCALRLLAGYEGYGRKITQGKLLNFLAEVSPRWDDTRKRVQVDNIRVRAGNDNYANCLDGAICLRVGPYGPAGHNVVCYHVDAMPPEKLTLAMSEPEARALSQRAGDISSLRVASFLYEVTQPVKLRPSYGMCTGKWSRDKVMAEGRARFAGEILWGNQRSEYARRAAKPEAEGPRASTTANKVPLLRPAPAPATGREERSGKVVIEPE